MTEWRMYRRRVTLSQMRPWREEDGDAEALKRNRISVSDADTPGPGGMIARNVDNLDDQWYVSKDYFEQNFEV